MVLALLALLLQTRYGASVEVRVVNVDVVVTDKAGHRVTGLTKDDFEILEDGKPQKITNFDEERGVAAASAAGSTVEAAAAAHRPRRFIIFVDNDSLQTVARKRLFTALRHFAETQLLPGDQASLISWSRGGGLRIAAPLTDNRTILGAALNALEMAPSPASVVVPIGARAEGMAYSFPPTTPERQV